MFDSSVTLAIKQHAIACYPQEACGVVLPTGFQPLQNRAAEPRRFFDCRAEINQMQVEGQQILAVVHSHPDGPDAPSGMDIASQRAMDIPWGLVVCNAEEAGQPWYWGDSLEPPPLEGRPFRHGPSGTDGKGDCGALLRDWYRLERGILIPDFEREDRWWMTPGRDHYTEHFQEAGFTRIHIEETPPEPGDVILMQLRCPPENPVPNHAAIYLGNHLMMHHLENRLSRVEPVFSWSKFVRMWLRHAAR